LAKYFPDSKPAKPARRSAARKSQSRDAIAPAPGGLDTRSMEGMLWSAACAIRGEKDAPKFKDYILLLVFVKRLSDVFDDELARLAEQFGDEATARAVIEADPSVVRFFVPEETSWAVVSGRKPFAWPDDRRPTSRRDDEACVLASREHARLRPRLKRLPQPSRPASSRFQPLPLPTRIPEEPTW
jgi:hypothetical protein